MGTPKSSLDCLCTLQTIHIRGGGKTQDCGKQVLFRITVCGLRVPVFCNAPQIFVMYYVFCNALVHYTCLVRGGCITKKKLVPKTHKLVPETRTIVFCQPRNTPTSRVQRLGAKATFAPFAPCLCTRPLRPSHSAPNEPPGETFTT